MEGPLVSHPLLDGNVVEALVHIVEAEVLVEGDNTADSPYVAAAAAEHHA